MTSELKDLIRRARAAMEDDDGSNDQEHDVLIDLVDYLEEHYGADTTNERSVSGTCIR